MQLRLTKTTSNGVEKCERQFSQWPCARCWPARRSVSPTRRRAAQADRVVVPEERERARAPEQVGALEPEQVQALEPLARRPATGRAVAQAAQAPAPQVPDPTGAPAARVAPRHFVRAGATIPPGADDLASWPDQERRCRAPARQLFSVLLTEQRGPHTKSNAVYEQTPWFEGPHVSEAILPDQRPRARPARAPARRTRPARCGGRRVALVR